MRKAIVVGGGLSGISAALALQDSGEWNVSLFEARKQLGGRVSSIRDPDTGLRLDNCQHACFRVYDHFLQLISICNAESSIRFQQRIGENADSIQFQKLELFMYKFDW